MKKELRSFIKNVVKEHFTQDQQSPENISRVDTLFPEVESPFKEKRLVIDRLKTLIAKEIELGTIKTDDQLEDYFDSIHEALKELRTVPLNVFISVAKLEK